MSKLSYYPIAVQRANTEYALRQAGFDGFNFVELQFNYRLIESRLTTCQLDQPTRSAEKILSEADSGDCYQCADAIKALSSHRILRSDKIPHRTLSGGKPAPK